MFENRLPLLEFDIVNPKHELTIKIEPRKAKLSDNASTIPTENNIWRYIVKGSDKEDNAGILETNLGPIINVTRGTPLTVNWVNTLDSMANRPPSKGMPGQAMPPIADKILEMPPINPIPMDFKNEIMKGMNYSVGVVTHLHGGKVEHDADGWPLNPLSFPENPYHFPETASYTYPNNQRAAMLWFHDHGMDNTAPQVFAGLAGLYFIRDESDTAIFDLLGGLFQDIVVEGKVQEQKELMELPLVIQDRMVDCDFCCVDYWAGIPTNNTLNSDETAIDSQDFVRPEFLGETIFVNGRPWPHHEVRQKAYRLRIVNGSNARTYALALIDPSPWSAMQAAKKPKVWHSDLLTVIGNDGGLFAKSQSLKATDYILIAPGERLDLILDLTNLCPDVTEKLRMVNLAVNSARNGDWPEAIFQTETDIKIASSNVSAPSSILQPRPVDEFDANMLASLLAIKQANLMQFCIKHNDASCHCRDDLAAQRPKFLHKLDSILSKYAVEEGFHWNKTAKVLEPMPVDAPVACNRLVLLMNDTSKLGPAINPLTKSAWRDTQIWEMGPAKADEFGFSLPFYVDLTTDNPKPGNPVAIKNYNIQRATFFETDPAKPLITDSTGYPKEHKPTFKPKAGSYERWYVGNIGNQQPLTAGFPNDPSPPNVPDMHPFHIHLVNFVVLRRFVLNPGTNSFVPVVHDNTFDTLVRHDTVRIQSNELLELLVYFPPGFKGKYPYHCHLVEHEDMGMMLHFEVI